jgi:hypothetical protein
VTGQPVLLAFEDEVTGAVLRKLVTAARPDLVPERVFNARGKARLRAGLQRFKNASHVIPHIVLTDLDRLLCPPALLADWGAADLPPRCLLRVAVREVEAWLLADREGIAEFLAVAVTKVPREPEREEDPKRSLINLARRSRRRRLTEEILPGPGSSAPIGPLYNSHLTVFVADAWSPERARVCAPSLKSALRRFVLVPDGIATTHGHWLVRVRGEMSARLGRDLACGQSQASRAFRPEDPGGPGTSAPAPAERAEGTQGAHAGVTLLASRPAGAAFTLRLLEPHPGLEHARHRPGLAGAAPRGVGRGTVEDLAHTPEPGVA